GMGSITQAMAAAAREAGAELRVEATVARIITTDGRARGARPDDGTEPTRARLLPGRRDRADRRDRRVERRSQTTLLDPHGADGPARWVPRLGRGDQDGRAVREGEHCPHRRAPMERRAHRTPPPP